MKLLVTLALVMCLAASALAQVDEDFSDGEFNSAPQWTGNTGEWQVNSDGQLQSGSNIANSSFFLVTPSQLAISAQWELYVQLRFNTSSTNYADIFLISSSSDLNASTTTGYFVRIGNSLDEVSLYRKDPGGIVKIIDGTDGITNSSDNVLRIRVARDATNRFILLRDATGSGLHYAMEGSAVDDSYTSSSWFGMLVKQSTSSFFNRHYFDNIQVRSIVVDTIPPAISSSEAEDANHVAILFSETPDNPSVLDPGHYQVDHGVGPPLTILQDPDDPALVHLNFSPGLVADTNYQITVSGVKDIWGNILSFANSALSFHIIRRYELVIDELLADASPTIGLPAYEFIELKNRSGHTLQLGGMKLQTPSSTGSPFPSLRLAPDSFVIVTTTAASGAFSVFGRVIGLPSFPALDNNGSIISLISKEGITLHAVAYSSSLYNNQKVSGGWSLEMIDTEHPCVEENNWTASTDLSGGTPGKVNSVAGTLTDSDAPALLRTYTVDSLNIVAVFNENMDSLAVADPLHYSMSNGNSVVAAMPVPPLFRSCSLTLATPLQGGGVLELSVNALTDCSGNEISAQNTAKTGLPQLAALHDIVVNEVLFHPRSGGADYVELYNPGKKIIDISALYISDRKISSLPWLMFPGEYMAFTADVNAIGRDYFIRDPQALHVLDLPSFPNDGGSVILLDLQGNRIDQVDYSESWHFPLITDPTGVALERIDPLDSSSAARNWHSAAATAGWGTPGYRNSQYRITEIPDEVMSITPTVFSPDDDGIDDVAIISYSLKEPGWMARILIFDAYGRPVRKIAGNELLGIKGKWTWDGLDENRLRLHPGIYIVYARLFDLKGKVLHVKKTVVVTKGK